ncbi:phosphotransferase [Streptomyces incarnatus]
MWVENLLGSEVVASATQHGGFSPGVASRLRFAHGGRAFVKAVSADVNIQSAALHRRERSVSSAMPRRAPVPELLGALDNDGWVALVYTDVEGRHPGEPVWTRDEAVTMLRGLRQLHQVLTPAPLSDVPSLGEQRTEIFGGWARLAALQVEVPDVWCARNLARIVEWESYWTEAATGDTLLHGDLRSDNMLLTSGGMQFVDWAWACRGAAWFDVAAMAPSIAARGGPPPEWLMETYGVDAADADAVTAVVAAVAGYFTEQAGRPDPPGIHGLRRFQAQQGSVARAWLQARLERGTDLS